MTPSKHKLSAENDETFNMSTSTKPETHVDGSGAHWKFRTQYSKVQIEDIFEIHQDKVRISLLFGMI